MVELSVDQIKKVKLIETELLEEFIHVCDALSINYYIIGGTLLGAVRHQGFIPWDDDIDVGMIRSDYEYFKQNAAGLFSDKVFLQNYETDQDFPLSFIKLRRNGTTFIEESMKDFNIHHGVFIDVFPLDYYPEGKVHQFIVNMKNGFLNKRINVELGLGGSNWVSMLKGVITRMLIPNYRDAVKMKDLLFRKSSNYPSRYIRNYNGAWGLKEIVPFSCFGDGVPIQFENVTVNAPKLYDEYLSCVYGDYMKLPPEEKRQPHHSVHEICL